MYTVMSLDHDGALTEYRLSNYYKAQAKAKKVYTFERTAFVQVFDDNTDKPVLSMGICPTNDITRLQWFAWGVIISSAIVLTSIF